jgi:alkylhydroperoxidase family enzyme
MGVTEPQLRDLACYRTSDAFDDAERVALDLAVQMAKTPTEIPSELIVRLRAHFDQTQIVELAAAIAWEHYRARFNRVFGVRPCGFSEGAFCALAERPSKP